MIQRVTQTDRCGGFTFSGSSRSDCRDEDQFCIGFWFERLQVIQRVFGLEVAIQQKIAEIDAQFPMRNLRDGQHVRFLSNFYVGLGVLMLIVHGSSISWVKTIPMKIEN